MVIRLLLLLLLGAVIVAVAAAAAAPTHTSTEIRGRLEALRTRMSTKTPYPEPTAVELAAELTAERQAASDGHCRAAQLNYVLRHGTRFPTKKDIARIDATHRRLRTLGSPLPPSMAWVHAWENPYELAREGWLAEAGARELEGIGQRLRERFGAALDAHFAANRFVFEHTYKPRTLQSAMAFAFGLFHRGHQPVYYHADAIGADEELRFYENCPAFDRAIDQNTSATIEHRRYRTNPQMVENLRRFRLYAGDAHNELQQADLEAAYAACAFDAAVFGQTNAWCGLFDEEMLLSMDYFHDLKHFYKKSHGNAMAFEIASPLLQDLHRSMKQRVEGQSRVQGHFRFAHAETILPLASLLNMTFFDRHLSDRQGHFLADTPLMVAKQRAFHGGILAPFSANIGFVLYECEGQADLTAEDKGRDYRVQTLFHERTVTFPECGHQILCPFRRFENMFGQWIHEYDFFAQCKA